MRALQLFADFRAALDPGKVIENGGAPSTRRYYARA
jgi:hypothetical protein